MLAVSAASALNVVRSQLIRTSGGLLRATMNRSKSLADLERRYLSSRVSNDQAVVTYHPGAGIAVTAQTWWRRNSSGSDGGWFGAARHFVRALPHVASTWAAPSHCAVKKWDLEDVGCRWRSRPGAGRLMASGLPRAIGRRALVSCLHFTTLQKGRRELRGSVRTGRPPTCSCE